MTIAVPRDRAGTFAPALVPKQATRPDGLNAVLTSLYAKGMSVRDIARQIADGSQIESRREPSGEVG